MNDIIKLACEREGFVGAMIIVLNPTGKQIGWLSNVDNQDTCNVNLISSIVSYTPDKPIKALDFTVEKGDFTVIT